MKMGESSLEFEAYFYVNMYAIHDRDNAIDKANTLIYEALQKNTDLLETARIKAIKMIDDANNIEKLNCSIDINFELVLLYKLLTLEIGSVLY